MDRYLKLTGSLLAVEQSCCDCVLPEEAWRLGSEKETILTVQVWSWGAEKDHFTSASLEVGGAE